MSGHLDGEIIARAEDADRIADALAASWSKTGAVVAGGLAMIGRRGKTPFWKARSKVARGVVERQKRLETAHAVAPLLPMAAGAEFKTEAAAKAFLTANAASLEDGLARLGDSEQHQITIDLPFNAALERVRAGEEWAEIEAAGRTASSASEKRAFVARLAEEAHAFAAALGETASRMLADVADDVERLPVDADTTVLNAVFLTKRGGGAALEGVLEAIDADWSGALKIKIVGPGPAASFGSVLVEKADLGAAAATLGVAPTATREEVDAAYRAAMRKAHPDHAGEGSTAAAAALAEATRLMRRSAEARRSIAAAGLSAAAGGLALARLYREGEGGVAR